MMARPGCRPLILAIGEAGQEEHRFQASLACSFLSYVCRDGHKVMMPDDTETFLMEESRSHISIIIH